MIGVADSMRDPTWERCESKKLGVCVGYALGLHLAMAALVWWSAWHGLRGASGSGSAESAERVQGIGWWIDANVVERPIPVQTADGSERRAQRDVAWSLGKPRLRTSATERTQTREHVGSKRSGRGGDGSRARTGTTSGDSGVGAGEDGTAFVATVCSISSVTKSLKQHPACIPIGTLRTNAIDVAARRYDQGFPGVPGRFEWFMLDYQGRFTTTVTGSYVFRLHSDDGSILWIDGREVIDNDGEHVPRSKFGSIFLDQGTHTLRVQYFQGLRDEIALQLFVTAPFRAEQVMQPSL